MRSLIVLAMATFITACGHAPAGREKQNCAISASEREVLMKLDYRDFDQSLPSGGWRKYEMTCMAVARDLIEEYISNHSETLNKSDSYVLSWHSGQMSAGIGETERAIASMEKSIHPDEKPDDPFHWNAYARATIALLKKDRAQSLTERDNLARGDSP